ncbi:PLP-dependent aminotransferase family protein [Myroides odoratimimus]|nr:PLP-dependent aminotransferase family protein [Myroides odoratimimus]MDM1036941.1 PLP-dependent aminotransferase family protein [Myroides odoratimimus]
MLPYKTLIKVDRDSIVPLYIQVCNAFISLITDGTLKPSDILPSTRNLALLVGINRNTVKLAYEELISQGWTESIERKGVYVLSTLPSISKKSIGNEPIKNLNQEAFKWTNKFKDVKLGQNFQKTKLAIDDGFPDVRLAPIDELMREYRSISRKFYGRNYLKYGSPQGSENLREALSNYLSTTRGLNASINDLLITKGSQMGIYLSAQLLLDPGDTIAVGMSNYPTADQIFKQAGANLLRIPIDHNGMDVDYLENKLKKQKIKAVYIIPHHHSPTTVTLSMERRLKFLKLAKEHQFAIIEDDYDFDFHYANKTYLPLASIDHNQNVIYLGSITKTFAPALRIGFMTGPANFIYAATALRELIDRQGDTTLEEAFASLFNQGEMNRYYRKALKTYKERRDTFCCLLDTNFSNQITFKVPEGGLAIWAIFNPEIDLMKLSHNALKQGLYLDNGLFYKNEGFATNGIRMGFASLDEKEMIEACAILKKVMY